ncbi:unnamed protein product [Rodentolepis nana]|uniref:Uncharacterized protein n=1 Tax=Rodentolepis nana TaxID=102285 RepID=A0A0R3TBT3_RODNA|nr:unnamed protein product [Rodentolepis nana]
MEGDSVQFHELSIFLSQQFNICGNTSTTANTDIRHLFQSESRFSRIEFKGLFYKKQFVQEIGRVRVFAKEVITF